MIPSGSRSRVTPYSFSTTWNAVSNLSRTWRFLKQYNKTNQHHNQSDTNLNSRGWSYNARSRLYSPSWKSHGSGLIKKMTCIINLWNMILYLMLRQSMRSGRLRWMRALNASPSLQDDVKSLTLTPGYLAVDRRAHLSRASRAVTLGSCPTTMSDIWKIKHKI